MQTFYVTTPIYYVNDEPHLGHLYTTVAADVTARHQRLAGRDVLFLTGTDEHGQKVQEAAEKRGITPIELADSVVARYRALWPLFSISHNDFIRTTEERHKLAIAALWQRLEQNGALYKGVYEDWYCVPCESYWTATQIAEAGGDETTPAEPHCPDCRRPLKMVKEESWFLRLSAFQERLLQYLYDHPEFVGPASRRNEVIRFVESGLRDLSISRTTFSWGIKVPGDESHVIYVWLDALGNYLTAAGFPNAMKFWPADLHLIGKDILRFHAVYWPIMLMAADLPLPKRIFAHGWWTVEGEKMSKSRGNALRPNDLLAEFDADVIRYFLLREVPFGQDGDFAKSALQLRYNSELANDLGNLLNRSLSMLHKYRDGVVPVSGSELDEDRQWLAHVEQMQRAVDEQIGRQAFHEAIESINGVVRHGNRYIEESKPWVLFKNGELTRLDTVLYNLTEGLRLIGLQLLPFMPNKAAALLEQIYNHPVDGSALHLRHDGGWGGLTAGHQCGKPAPLFPRIELNK